MLTSFVLSFISMLGKINFTDFYKFIVSLGLCLVFGAILLPWTVLVASKDLLITSEELSALTKESLELFQLQQSLSTTFLKTSPWISGCMLLAGFALMVYGICRWKKKQAWIDRGDKAEVEKKEYELTKMTQDEKVQKAVTDSFSVDSVDGFESPDKSSVNVDVNSPLKKYYEIEKVLEEKLHTNFSNLYKVGSNMKLADVGYDFVLNSLKFNRDYLIELKTYKNPSQMRRAVDQSLRLLDSYLNKTNKRTTLTLLFVVDSEDIKEKFKNKIPLFYDEVDSRVGMLQIRILTFNELQELDMIGLAGALGLQEAYGI